MSISIKHSKCNGSVDNLKARSNEALDRLWEMSWVKSSIGDTSEMVETAENAGGEFRYKSDVLVVIGSPLNCAMLRGALSAISHKEDKVEVLFLGEDFSASAYDEVLRKLENKNFTLIAIATEAESLGQRAAFACIRKVLSEKYGPSGMTKRTIVIASGNSEFFIDEASKGGGRVFALPEDTNSSYAAGSMAMVLPLAAFGIDGAAYMDGFKEMLADTCWDADGDKYSLCLSQGYDREDIIIWQRELTDFGVWVAKIHERAGLDSKVLIMPADSEGERNDAYGAHFIVEKEEKDIMLPSFPGCNSEGSLNLLLNEEADALFKGGDDHKPATMISLDELSPYSYGRLVAFIQISAGITSFILEN